MKKLIIITIALMFSTTLFAQSFDPRGFDQQLIDAVKSGNLSRVEELVGDYNVNVNAKDDRGMTSLMYAARHGHIEIVKFLRKNGADVNAKNENGWTSLMYAARHGHIEIVKFLMEKGADVNAKNKWGITPLMYAAKYGHIGVVKLLTYKWPYTGVDTKDHEGRTAFDYAKDGEYKEHKKEIMEHLKERMKQAEQAK